MFITRLTGIFVYLSYFILLPLTNNFVTPEKYLPIPIVDNDIDIEMIELILHISRNHLRNSTSTFVIVEKSATLNNSIRNVNILEEFLKNSQGNIAVQLGIHSENEQPWEYYVFIVDSLHAFREILGLFPMSLYERHFYFIIILTEYREPFDNIIKKMFQLCYEINVIDVIVIVKHPTEGLCIFTYLLYSQHACRTVQPILYQKLTRNFENLKTIFPQKLDNFYGCPINISGRIVGPFLALLGNSSNPQPVGAWENLSGVEGLLIRELATALNFRLDRLTLPEDGSYVENSTAHGCFQEVENGEADIALGGFSAGDPGRNYFSQSFVYHSSPFVYVVRSRELSPMERLAKPFTKQLWIALVIILFIGFTITIVLRFFKFTTHQYIERNEDLFLKFITIFLGYSINQPPAPSRNFARYVLLLLIFLTFVIRNAYQGSLFDAIRRDSFVKIPSGYKEIVDWNYKILISPEVALINAYPKNMTVIVPSGGYLKRIKILETVEKRYASAILRDSFIHHLQKNNWKSNDLFMSREVIIMHHFVMFFAKNSIYLDTINNKLRALTCAGIMNKLKFNLTSEEALRSRTKREPPNLALSLKRLKGMYDIYLGMKVLAIVVFGLEIISIRYVRLRRVIQWIG